MKSGICPKCGSKEVYKKKSMGHVRVWVSFWISTYPQNYVCADCGYVEWYIENRSNLEKIRNKWEHASGKRKRKNDEV